MITKKLMHDIQTWLNSLYDFKNKNNIINKHIISSIENFHFKFISVNIRIWSLRKNGSLDSVYATYYKDIRNNEDFKEFKDRVTSDINKYIKVAIEESHYLPLSD